MKFLSCQVLIASECGDAPIELVSTLEAGELTVQVATLGSRSFSGLALCADALLLDADLSQPGAGGLIRHIRRLMRPGWVPILHLADSAADPASITRAHAAGADAVLPIPTDPAAAALCLSTVKAMLRASQLARQSIAAEVLPAAVSSDEEVRWLVEARSGRKNAILEQIATGEPVGVVLNAVAASVDAELPQLHCAILGISKESAGGNGAGQECRSMDVMAAPAMPIPSLKWIRQCIASRGREEACGPGCFDLSQATQWDLQEASDWQGCREHSEACGVRACWSRPIRDARGEVLGTLLLIGTTLTTLSTETDEMLSRFCYLAGIVMARDGGQAALRRSQEQYRELVENAFEGIWRLDPTARIVFVNPRMAELLGYQRHEMKGHSAYEFLFPEDRAPGERSWMRRKEGRRERSEARLRRRDGTALWVLATTAPLYDDEGAFAGALGMFTDISDRREAETAIRIRDSALLAAPHGVFIADARQRDFPIIYANQAALILTGYSEAEILGRNCRLLQGPDTDPTTIAEIRSALQRMQPIECEILNYRKDGSSFWNALSVSPIRDKAGRVSHFVGIQQDVTRRKEMERQLVHSQKMEAVGRLAGGVAHDFNNMLAVINGYCDLLLTMNVGPPDQRRYLDEILRAGERAAGLTRQLLAFSRRQVLEPRLLDLGEVTRGMHGMLARLIGEDIKFCLEIDEQASLQVRADPSQLEQVLLNLAVNARDAMPRGGRLTIRVSTDNTGPVNLPLERGEHHRGWVVLSVSDTGCGIPEELIPQIWEPFFSTKGDRGTGLGLATVYGIVNQSEGRITVESQSGEGTTMRLFLPAVSSDEPLVQPSVLDCDAPTANRATVLLVEDEEMVRVLVQQVLESQGHHVLVAESVHDALELAASHRGELDLLLTDVVMPGGVSGGELAKRLMESVPNLRVLFMSGYPDDELVRQGVAAESVAFIQKPFSPMTLSHRIQEIFSDSRFASADSLR